MFSDKQKRISEENRLDHYVNIQLRWMKEVLNYLYAIKLFPPDFACEIESSSDSPTATGQDVCTVPAAALLTDHKSSEYRLTTSLQQESVNIFNPFHFSSHWPDCRLRPRC